MSKWIKADPTALRVGDKTKCVDDDGSETSCVVTFKGIITGIENDVVMIGEGCYISTDSGTWYIRSDEPKKARPEPGLVEGHNAKHWHARWVKQLTHNEQIQRSATARNEKLKRLEAEFEKANLTIQKLDSAYAAARKATDETQAQLDDAMLTIAERTTELANLRTGKAEEPKPPTHPILVLTPPDWTSPDEPPIGSFFRVDRDGLSYRRVENPLNPNVTIYMSLSNPGVTLHWEDITEPGDTWTLLELREVGK